MELRTYCIISKSFDFFFPLITDTASGLMNVRRLTIRRKMLTEEEQEKQLCHCMLSDKKKGTAACGLLIQSF
jgi:hypothetical protein